MRVLVVDDEVDLAEAVARGLRREGYAVDVSNDGADALNKVMVTTYDLLCLDITMPGIDGREVCRRVRAEVDPQPRILMLTARDGLEDRVAGLDDGADEAKRGSRRLDLTAKEFALLRYFMLHAGEVISQETLLEHVWDEHADPFTNTVRVTVGTLRRKVSIDDETPLIETLIGSGYRLLDP